ncbi:UDP-Glc:alpha-D-GlcNAc-diphosphoundecaprenol beta-1,3-glucosyltransferase WfgD [Kordia sp. SMS9]|uniref:glycosyltransferase family 2 protein n=1 Tax=Kordia sp. SMS9 TaxID=2282170 RepID=UPI000E0CC8CC|nr:glycosyltransferase family 2 protein [Kordia sp. SMS9]AXG72331.1 UDP-Glc:alpha-D-GlcNAc-diphosphoundecaprenol beta-1,3-glucosyltransferase WfgD [Kordia sp. SMS9]
MPLFSVIIPLYNKQAYIQQTVESVLQQTCTDFELLIVNDASTDESVSVVSQISDSRIQLIENSENVGLSATRNHGISKANGEIIALLDADDVWRPNFLKTIEKLYITFPEASLYGTDYVETYTSHEDLIPRKNIDRSLQGTSFLISDFFKASMFQPIFCQSSLAFKKEICTEYEVFDSNITFAEDIDFYIQYSSKHRVAYHFEALAEVRFEVPDQMSKNAIITKTLPDLDRFEILAKDNNSLKKYLDLYRYIFASLYTLENAIPQRNAMLKHIDYNNLTFKQRFLLRSPRFVMVLVKKLKGFLLKLNVRVTSF